MTHLPVRGFSFRSDSFGIDHLWFVDTMKQICYSEKVRFAGSEDARIKYSPRPSPSLCGSYQRMDSGLLWLCWGRQKVQFSCLWQWFAFCSSYSLLLYIITKFASWNLFLLFTLPFCTFIIAYHFGFVNRFLKNIFIFLCIFIIDISTQFYRPPAFHCRAASSTTTKKEPSFDGSPPIW